MLLLAADRTRIRTHRPTRDAHLGAGRMSAATAKGRKDRNPAHQPDSQGAQTWLAELAARTARCPPGRRLRDAVERLVAKHAATAQAASPSIREKNVTPTRSAHRRHVAPQGRS